MRVEDHPVDYLRFEGLIPEGNFGAEVVFVRDHGRWAPVKDFNEITQGGELLFDLYGNKLGGRGSPCNWRKFGPIIYS